MRLIRLLLPALLALAAAACPTAPLQAQGAEAIWGIAAKVNERIVTGRELEDRLRLEAIAANLPPTPQTVQQLLPSILQRMIEEELQMEEAERQEITVTDEQIDAQIATIAKENDLTAEALLGRMRQGGGEGLIRALRRQVRAGLSWREIVQRTGIRQVKVSTEEIRLFLERLRSAAGKPEYQVLEILIPIGDQGEVAARAEAEAVVAQLRGGASFRQLARQVSAAPGAATGGDLGWLPAEQMEPALRQVVEALPPRSISDPIPVEGGFQIVTVANIRTIEFKDGGGPSEQEIRGMLSQQKLRVVQSRMLRDLIASARIERLVQPAR